MRVIRYIIQKEFKQIFRNRMMLPIIFVMPVIQLIVLSYTATFEIKEVRLGVVDMDQSYSSRELVSKFQGSPFFKLVNFSFSIAELEKEMQKGDLQQIVVIPQNFEAAINKGENPKIQIITDAVNGSAASLMTYYTSSIVMDYNRQILMEKQPLLTATTGIRTPYQFWYNPELDYKNYMVPGILVLLVTMIGAFLSGMNIVREKEIGTIEQLNVTPIRKYEFIIGKLLPFWIIAMFDLAFGLIIAKLIFGIYILGSVWLVFAVAAIYLLAVLGLGLFVSTITETQQQAMFLAWFFMVIFIMLSGLFTPTESMPIWAQWLNTINPITYFMRFMRQVILKGSSIMEVMDEIISITVYATSMLSLAVWRYRKVN